LLLHALVHPADIQDRDGGVLVLKTLFGRYPFLTKLFADGGYQGPIFAKGHAGPGDRNRQAIRHRRGLRGPAQALGRGALCNVAKLAFEWSVRIERPSRRRHLVEARGGRNASRFVAGESADQL
jgi:hypothetical protein